MGLLSGLARAATAVTSVTSAITRTIAHPIKTIRGDYREPQTNNSRVNNSNSRPQHNNTEQQAPREKSNNNWVNDSNTGNSTVWNKEKGFAVDSKTGMVDPSSYTVSKEEQEQFTITVKKGTSFESGDSSEAADIAVNNIRWGGFNKARTNDFNESVKRTLNKIDEMIEKNKDLGFKSGQFEYEYDSNGNLIETKEIIWNASEAIIKGMDHNEVWRKFSMYFNTDSEVLPYHESVS